MTLHLDNYINGFDFSPNGDNVATLDTFGVCVVSNVRTDNYLMHLLLESDNGGFGN